MANILVLGGSGFVSEALSKYLIRRGYSIDILKEEKRKYLLMATKTISFVIDMIKQP